MTSEAPERIWAWEYKGNCPWGPKKPDLDVVTNGAEYIRADLHQQAIAAAYDDAKRYLTGDGVYAQWDRKQYPPEFLDWLKTLAEDIGDSCPKEADSALRQALAEAEARGYARAIEEAFDKVESLSHDWGEDGCAYIDRDEALTEIRALAQKEGA